ncbi:MAG: hypothetical protein E7614_07420 [Ruminococcaceae bacterium]|nr:hypothetical protein [Oscillospiraceae bacterium]
MTERLFETQSHMSLFHANVLECEKEKNIYKIVLDKTTFFPEGGGQKGDVGYITLGNVDKEDFFRLVTEESGEEKTVLASGVVNVSDTQEKNGIIYHFCDAPLEVGVNVTGLVDFDIRFPRMQNHTGEHIVSGIINRYFGFDNVGFHMGSEDVTLDINGTLTKEQLDFVELEANKAVVLNVPVFAEVFSGEALSSLNYRSKLDLTENVRIVTVEGYDKCACCAPHVNRTGEIGIIKLLGFMNYKQGIRIHMLCGFDAIKDYEAKLSQTKASSALLSAKPNELALGIERLLEENKKEKQQSNDLKNIIASLMLEKAKETGKKCLFTEINDPVFLRYLATGGADLFGVCGAFCQVSEANYRYVAVSKERDMRAFAKEMNSALNGRGGGDNELVQGSVKAYMGDIEAFFENVK